MCLATPMKIERMLEDGRALVSQDELQTEIDLSLVENAKPEDYVIVHAGFALEILDLEEARQRLALFDQLSGATQAPTDSS